MSSAVPELVIEARRRPELLGIDDLLGRPARETGARGKDGRGDVELDARVRTDPLGRIRGVLDPIEVDGPAAAFGVGLAGNGIDVPEVLDPVAEWIFGGGQREPVRLSRDLFFCQPPAYGESLKLTKTVDDEAPSGRTV
jgi:hypothetical protein